MQTLQRLVYLLRKLARWSHDEAVYCVVGVRFLLQERKEREQICCRLACSCLGNADNVPSLKYRGYALCLNRSTLLETHVVERVEDILGEG